MHHKNDVTGEIIYIIYYYLSCKNIYLSKVLQGGSGGSRGRTYNAEVIVKRADDLKKY